MLRLRASVCLLVPLAVACGDDGRGDSAASAASSSISASIGSIGSVSISAGSSGESSGGGSGGSGGSGGDTDGATGVPTTSDGSGTSAGTAVQPKFDLGTIPDVELGCGGGGGGMLDTSYIWVPSTSDGWVSKIDTRQMLELARYRTGPSGGGESVSRTAVSGDGRFVVVNARGTGRSTAVAANIDDCIDLNADGQITTSTGPNDILPWGADECVVWSLVHPDWGGYEQAGPRGITWTAGQWNPALCAYENPKVWLGYLDGSGNGHLVRLDGATGVVEESVLAPGWNGSGWAPYGGALDPLQRPWFTGLRGELVRVNTDQNPITLTRLNQPGDIQSYGMTVDPDGNPWMGGCSGPVSTYDVDSGQWITIAGTSSCHRGMAVDHNFHVWTAANGNCGIVEVDGMTRTLVAHHVPPKCSTPIGVSVDVDGYVWLVDQEGWAHKIDPDNPAAMQYMDIPGSHYVYSDMTGGQLKSVSPPPG